MSTGSKSSRPRAAHLGPERRRPLVLDAALRVYLDAGFDGASMDAIAREAGVTKPVLYDCFASKAVLFGALMEREEERLLSHLAKSFEAGGEDLGDAEGSMRLGFRAFFEAVAAAPDSYRATLLAPESLGNISSRIEEARRMQADRIAERTRVFLEAAGDTDADRHAALLAQAAVGVGEAFARLLLDDPERWDPERLAREAAAMLNRGGAALVGS